MRMFESINNILRFLGVRAPPASPTLPVFGPIEETVSGPIEEPTTPAPAVQGPALPTPAAPDSPQPTTPSLNRSDVGALLVRSHYRGKELMARNVAHVGLNIQCYNKHQQQLDASERLMKTNQEQVTRNQDLQEIHEKDFARLLDLMQVSDAQPDDATPSARELFEFHKQRAATQDSQRQAVIDSLAQGQQIQGRVIDSLSQSEQDHGKAMESIALVCTAEKGAKNFRNDDEEEAEVVGPKNVSS